MHEQPFDSRAAQTKVNEARREGRQVGGVREREEEGGEREPRQAMAASLSAGKAQGKHSTLLQRYQLMRLRMEVNFDPFVFALQIAIMRTGAEKRSSNTNTNTTRGGSREGFNQCGYKLK